MKIAYLIMTHGHFEHLARIVNSLASQETTFFIHIDRRIEKNQEEIKSLFSDAANVYLVERRLQVNWGGFSIVEAVLNLLDAAIRQDHYDYLSLLSGQDFPVKSNRSIQSFLKEHAGMEFIQYFTLPDFSKKWDHNGGQDRYNYFWLVDDLGVDRSRLFAEAQRREGSKRIFPNGWQPYGGSMWFTITRACAQYICEYLAKHPDLTIFFRLTLIPDEMLIHTLLLNSRFRKCIINNNLRYIDWSTNFSPKILTISDFSCIKESDCHFARKFDDRIDRQIIHELEKTID